MNVYRIDRLNKNWGFIFYYQLIPFVCIKVDHQILDFKIKLIQGLKILWFWSESDLGLT